MLNALIEIVTGRDDLERVASKKNATELLTYLKSRKLIIPRKPTRFIPADQITQETLLELTKGEADDMQTQFIPWILEIDGKKRLAVFSNQKRFHEYITYLSKSMNMVFAAGSAEVLADQIRNQFEVDVLELNPASHKGWDICFTRTENGTSKPA